MATKVTIFNNGPIRIEGEIHIGEKAGQDVGMGGRAAIGLGRWGLSANKPFCDGAHAAGGFSSVCEARDLPPPKPKV